MGDFVLAQIMCSIKVCRLVKPTQPREKGIYICLLLLAQSIVKNIFRIIK